MADGDDYQPRTSERLVEILRAQSQNPRSWPNEAADTIERFRDALVGLVGAVVRDSSDLGKGISGYTSARLFDAQAALLGAYGRHYPREDIEKILGELYPPNAERPSSV